MIALLYHPVDGRPQHVGGRCFLLLVAWAWCSVFAQAQLAWHTLTPPAIGHDISVARFDIGAGAPTHVTVLTDGGKWGSETDVVGQLTALHAAHPAYPPTRYVLVGTIDSAAHVDHRARLFACGTDALRDALAQTVLPWAEGDLPAAIPPARRTLIGLSLGAAHAAYELTREDSRFASFVLLSPITYDCDGLAREIAFLSAAFAKTRRAYVSTGVLDAETYTRSLIPLLRGADVPTTSVTTDGDHDFANWDAQWPQLLAWLHAPGS